MGYHIVNFKDGNIEHDFVENIIDIVYLKEIKEDTIIYQGERHWVPITFGNSKEYKNYTKDWFRAGLKAQEVFKKQAKKEKLMLEELFQDENSFQQYLIQDEYLAIKRGDFLVRNYGHIEIDIKCRSFYNDKQGNKFFNFKCDDVEKHINMQSLTNSPIVIAVYERKGDEVVDGNPYFFSIEQIDFSSLNKTHIRSENTGYCYQIPLDKTVPDFQFIKKYFASSKSYSIQEKRLQHKNAYKSWTLEEDKFLEIHFCEKKTMIELCSIFGRNAGAIKSRIKKLELNIKYGD